MAKDDIIRLLKGDVAPTFIERITFMQFEGQDLDAQNKCDSFYNRGSKIGVSAEENMYEFKKDDDLNEVVNRNKRDFIYFIV